MSKIEELRKVCPAVYMATVTANVDPFITDYVINDNVVTVAILTDFVTTRVLAALVSSKLYKDHKHTGAETHFIFWTSPRQKLTVYVTEEFDDASPKEHFQAHRGECYETWIAEGLSVQEIKLIAYGLLFQADWTMQDTRSEWEVQK